MDSNRYQFGDDFCTGLQDHQAVWLRFFLDAEDTSTFMRAGPAAVRVGKRMEYGYIQKRLCAPRIKAFLAECGLDENSLKGKLVTLLNGRETKHMVVPGAVEEWELPRHTKIVGEFVREKIMPLGHVIRETVTLVSIDQEAPELQRKALDMALKVNGMYAPDKIEIPAFQQFLEAVAAKSKDLLGD